MLKFALILTLLAMPALAQTPVTPMWLVFPTFAEAQARSMAECRARGCDMVHSIYWWHVETNAATGEGAIRLESSVRRDGQDFTAGRMTTQEQNAIIPDAQLRGRSAGWIGR